MKTIVLFLAVLNFGGLFSQESNGNKSKLIEAFGISKIQELSVSNPGLLKLYSEYCGKGIIITKYDFRFKNAQKIKNVALRNKGEYLEIEAFINDSKKENFNPLLFAFLPTQVDQFYQLGETGLYLFIPSQQTLIAK